MWPMAKISVSRPEPDVNFSAFQALSFRFPSPSADPPLSVLSTCAYLSDSTSQLSLKLVILKIQGNQSLGCFLGLVKERECLTSSEAGE